MPKYETLKVISFVLFIGWMNEYAFPGYQKRFPECWNTAAHDGFLLSLSFLLSPFTSLNAFASRGRFLFPSDKLLMPVNTSADYDNKRYKSIPNF